MKPENFARAFLLGGRSHLCSGGDCDCVAELTTVIERACAAAVIGKERRDNRLRLAKPRIAEALEETRNAVRRRA